MTRCIKLKLTSDIIGALNANAGGVIGGGALSTGITGTGSSVNGGAGIVGIGASKVAGAGGSMVGGGPGTTSSGTVNTSSAIGATGSDFSKPGGGFSFNITGTTGKLLSSTILGSCDGSEGWQWQSRERNWDCWKRWSGCIRK